MAKDVTFNIKLRIDGKEQIVTASTNVKQFAQELEIARTESTRLRDDLLKITQVGASFQNAMTGLQQITGLMRSHTAANAVQAEAETKLANNMRNTMGAREEDIQSIKDLASAQQQLGVIGDEVQLAGAQELATYLEKKSSLEKLLPVMNDMLAQQYGLNATSESAAQIATMLGKVMDGQVGALSRYGYKFDEVQEQILKFGTEEQRAAVLADVVSSSVGGMNEALSKTDAGRAKQAANTIGDLKEQIGSVFASIEPSIIAVGELGMAFMSLGTSWQGIRGIYVAVAAATGSIKSMTVVTYAQAAAGKVATAVQALWAKQLHYGLQAQIAWTFGAKLATAQAIAMRAALLGLMVVTGLGLAFVAVSSAISLFTSKTGDATNSMRAAESEAKRLAEAQVEDAKAGEQAASTIELQKAKLKMLIDAKKTGKDVSTEEKKIVGELNDAYGDTMGYFADVSGWYAALIANSEAYCRQMVLEAKTRQLANQIAEKESETHNLLYDDKGEKKRYSKRREQQIVGAGVNARAVEIEGTSELEKVTQKVRESQAVVAALQKQMKDAVEEAATLDFKVKGSGKRPGGKDGGNTSSKKEVELIENASTYRELASNVEYYEQEIEKCNIADTDRLVVLAKAKKAAEDAIDSFKDMTDASTMPFELTTLDDYDKKLNSLRKDRKTASKDHISQIDAEIERIEAAKEALEDESVASLKDEEIRTWEELNSKLSYYRKLLSTATSESRPELLRHIKDLEEIESRWQQADRAASLNLSVDGIATLKEVNDALSFYSDRQQREDASQIAKTQALIDGLTTKKKALELGIELPSMRREVSEIESLRGRDYRVKIESVGFDGLLEKIRDIDKQLSNPHLTDVQKQQLESLKKSYAEFASDAAVSLSTFRQGWDGIKDIGSSIEGITSALKGNGNAWQRITGIVDGFLHLYEGISTIVGIIDMLTAATTAHTTAKTAEAVAVGVSGTAEAAAAAGAEASALAEVPLIAANKAATASYMELAAAQYMAAHAYIPFAGFGIGSGFAMSAAALVEAIGAMPFAKGGVVSGPTVALIGEYAGASTNPEVVAPLDRLRSLISPEQGLTGDVRFEIDGDKLVGILRKRQRWLERS